MTIDLTHANTEPSPPAPARGRALEVFLVALGLGLTAFGGPIAHIGYFERTYVQRRRWLSADDYAGIVALCQMIPGPASSQVGFLIGLRRAGWAGGAAAWLGFTLPSALIMVAFALLAPSLSSPLARAAVHGLQLVAVAVVAQAVWSMAGKLCPDAPRAALAVLAAAVLLVFGGAMVQLVALAIGGVGGAAFCRSASASASAPRLPVSGRVGAGALVLFVVLLAAAFAATGAAGRTLPGLAAIDYRAGALVFGGGHVVLPLLREALVPGGWLTDSRFLAGYGAAQALPGPLFTFAAYIGAAAAPQRAGPLVLAAWSSMALVAIFLPGLLAAIAGSALWRWIGAHAIARGALGGINAAVVGVLGAALYNPIWIAAVFNGRDLAIALVGFVLLERWRAPPIAVVGLCVAGAVLSSLI